MVEQRNSYGETVEKRWWNSGTMMVEQWNGYSATVEQNSGPLEKLWWNRGTVMVEQLNSGTVNRYGGTVQQ